MTNSLFRRDTALIEQMCTCFAVIKVGDQVVLGMDSHLAGPFCSEACLRAESDEMDEALARVTYGTQVQSKVTQGS